MRQESDSGGARSDGAAVADMKRWIYSSFLLTLGIAAFMWQWWRGEMAIMDARVLGVETRLHQQIADSEERLRSDLKDARDRVDKVNDKLDTWFFALKQEAPAPAPPSSDRARR